MEKRQCECGNIVFEVYKSANYYLHKNSDIPFAEDMKGKKVSYNENYDKIIKIECIRCKKEVIMDGIKRRRK